jgi:hypothetical protein
MGDDIVDIMCPSDHQSASSPNHHTKSPNHQFTKCKYHPQVDVSDLRKGILRALEEARKDVSDRRRLRDDAAVAYEKFVEHVAAPLMRQAADVLRAEKHDVTVQTPGGSVRLVSDRSAQDFIELELDTTGPSPQVVGRTSLARGRKGVVVEERPIAPGKAIDQITESDVAKFLLTEIQRLVTKP